MGVIYRMTETPGYGKVSYISTADGAFLRVSGRQDPTGRSDAGAAGEGLNVIGY
ncbi:MAG: hypothetical protein [Olavius algarvensis Gamma 1 endosymbiont]|nr:MAG: hypothetical protein [Olavius algarvensis Gamma 1 endosymbiont]